MGLNEVAAAERTHIAFFGVRNAGKSSLVNAVTGQNMSLVSDVKGTTTDPVQKTMELLPIGPVVIIDTPGIDDEGELGKMRVQRAKSILSKTDLAVLVADCTIGLQEEDFELKKLFEAHSIPYITVFGKCDLINDIPAVGKNEIYVSAVTGQNINELKELMASVATQTQKKRQLVGDIVKPGDIIVLVTPIDEAAPKGRLILPQQQTIRDILDAGAINVVARDTELEAVLAALGKKPSLVITDSQVFGKVNKLVPEDVPLTSFSILFARYKGELLDAVKGATALNLLKDGDTVLISEGCTHHRQCNDIGTVKLPDWIKQYTGKSLNFKFTSGGEFPEDLSQYSLIVHCGGCMLNEREMHSRVLRASKAHVPMTNYGIAIAQMHGILARSLSPFGDISDTVI